ncbi:hypothetical protein Sango_1600300 [Sesamum angolense]|uniref:Uncharacterized protein n=1 Tax=Sesamum angolense TaxID=2727404 RepID=A0AAE2BR55_9LAMI|nr:hypothetical protein Sango_1600300 [Sesamum angolense]
MTVSLNALNGNTDSNTFIVKGKTYGREVQILIDGGSTHCFLDETTTSELGCQLEQTTPMVVSVAKFSLLYCPTFTWEIQGKLFSYPMRTSTLRGVTWSLGVTSNIVAYDYNSMTVSVSQNGKNWELQAFTQQLELHLISAKSMSRFVNEEVYGFIDSYADLFRDPLSHEAHSAMRRKGHRVASSPQ